MSKVISFRDLKLIPELSHYNEIELLHRNLDETVQKYLAQIGFDTDYEVQYVPSKHRDMQGKVAVGFQAVGEISINRNFINSPLCSISERIAATGYQDPSLTRELSSMMASKNDYRGLSEVDGCVEDAEFGDSLVSTKTPKDEIEEDYEWVMQQIKQLEMVRDQIRSQG